MIFKTIPSSIDKSRKALVLFNKDWNIFKTNWQNAVKTQVENPINKQMVQLGGGGLKSGVLSIFNSNDVNCLKEYNRQIQAGIKPSIAYRNTMMDCTKEAKQNAVAIAKGTKTYKQAITSMNGMTISAKAASVALNAVSIAGNMLLFTAIAKGVQILIDEIDKLHISSEEYLEQQKEIISKSEEIISSTESEIDALESLQKKLEETNGSQAEMLKLADEIGNVLGKGNKNILTQANAYDVLTAKIKANLAAQKQEQDVAKKKKNQALIDSSNNEEYENDYSYDETALKEVLRSYWWARNKDGSASEEIDSKDYGNMSDFIDDKYFDAYLRRHPNQMVTVTPQTEVLEEYFKNQVDYANQYFADKIESDTSGLGSTYTKKLIDSLVLSGYTIGNDLEVFEDIFESLETNSPKLEELWNKYSNALSKGESTEDIKTEIDKLFAEILGGHNNGAVASVFNQYFNEMVIAFGDSLKTSEIEPEILKLFTSIFNSEDFEEHAKKLKELALAGELSPELLTATKEYRQLIDDTGLSAEEAVERIKEFALGESTLSDIISRIQSTSSLLKDVQNDISENGEISFEHIQSISSKLPSLEQEIRDYLNGVEGSQEKLVNKLKECYQEDLKNYDAYYEAKQGNDKVWWHNFLANSGDLVNELKKDYNIDLSNYSTYLLAKEQIQAMIDDAKSSASDLSIGIGSIFPDPLTVGGAYQYKAEKLQAYLDKIQKAFKDSINSSLYSTEDYTAGDSKSSKDSSTTFDWIETSLSNMEDTLDDLDNKVADTYAKWEDRNKNLADSILKTKEAIELQRDAAKAYEDEASEIKFSSSEQKYLRYVKEGLMDVETIKDKDLADRISNYQDLYEKSIECEKKALELERTLNELSSNEKWDLFKSKSDLQIEGADNIIDYQQSLVDKAELQGLFANEDYYKVMRMQNLRKQSELKKQYAELETILNTVPQGTEAYDTLFNEWMDIRNQLGELENEFIEFNNNIRDLDWEIFEYLEDSISRITEEVDFLKDLLSDEDMFDEYGNMTKYADATMGLHFTNIETYKKLAEDYYGEMQELQQQLADGAGQDVLEKYREYEDLHRDAITSIMDEKNAILDLVQNAYDEQINALERINDLTLERMDRERDLYNYQKNIAEKMKEKTSLERQISVYDGDDSEESKANVQRLKLELEKVNSDIEELQYEKQRADTEQMLTSITDNMKEWQSKRMDDEQGLLEEIKEGISTKSDEIKTTLTEVAGEYGTTLSNSLSDIFDSKDPFGTVVTAINNLIDKITSLVGDSNSDGDSNTPTDNPKPNTNTDVKQPTTNNNQPSQPIDTQSKSETDSIFIPQKSVYPKGELNKDKSATDWLKYHDYASDFQSRATYYKKLGGSGAYTGSGTQNSWLLKKMKEVGFAKGGTIGSLIKQTGEDGFVLARTGEEIFSLDKIEALSKTFQYAQPFMSYYNTPKMPNIQPRNMSNEVNLGGVHIAQVVTSDAQDFMRQLPSVIANDAKTQKVISEVVLGGALGRNSMSAKRFL